MDDFQGWLQNEFTRRCDKNPLYSLRAFSQKLGMHPSSVSQILQGKRKASLKLMKKMIDELQGSFHFGETASQLVADGRAEFEYSILEESKFLSISNWYYAAIMEATYLPQFNENPRWIAAQLGISAEQASAALDQLLHLGLLTRTKNRRIMKANRRLSTFKEGQTSAAHKALQKAVIGMALRAIDEARQSDKDITSMTVAVNKENLEQARNLIKKFRRDLADLLERASKLTSIIWEFNCIRLT